MTVDERARAGLFLAMQYPVEIPGVSTSNFLRTAAPAMRGEAPPVRQWLKEVKGAMADLQMDADFAERNVNEGFSGGEKKRHEVLQMSLLKPRFAVLDETDSGLDIDALRIVSEGVNHYKAASAEAGQAVGIMLITHYTRILRYIHPDFVHVFVAGRVVESGGAELAEELERDGYVRFTGAGVPA
jgi:Fe-S cluster assembly ATP-binding protein